MPHAAIKKPPYSIENITCALNAISNGMSQREAAKKYSIPRATLYDKIKGKYREGKGKGRDPFLSDAEERSLVG